MAAGQVLITSGPFRHNARATVTGEHLEALYEQIGRVVKAARRQARKEAAEASGLRAA